MVLRAVFRYPEYDHLGVVDIQSLLVIMRGEDLGGSWCSCLPLGCFFFFNLRHRVWGYSTPKKPHTYLTTFLPSSTARYFNRKEIKGRREKAWGSIEEKEEEGEAVGVRSREHIRWVVALRGNRNGEPPTRKGVSCIFLHPCSVMWKF